jgi:hypothetical protein
MVQNGRGGQPNAWLLALLGALPIALGRNGQLGDSDTFWQIRTGRLILLLGLAYRPGRLLVAVALIGVALTMVAVATQLMLAARLGAHPVAAGLMVLLATPITIAWFSVRPQLIDYAAVPLLIVLIETVLTAPARRTVAWALAGTALLQVGWVNLHATAPLGIALAAVAGAISGRRRLGRAAALVAAAALGTFLNPYGLGVLTEGAQVHGASTGLINEWMPIDLTEPFMDLTILLGLGTVAVAARRRWWRPAAILLVLVVAGIAVRRFQPILTVCAIPILAAALDTPRARAWAVSRRTMLRIGAAMLLIAYLTLAALAVPQLGRVGYPSAPIAALPGGCRLFNSYDLGGIVILRRPDVPVSLDSRNDLYGRADVLASERVLRGGPAAVRRLDSLGVTCVLVRPSTGLGKQLTRDPAWRVVSHHRDATTYVRRPTG